MNKKPESGAVSEEDFELAFEQTPVFETSSLKELKETMTVICQGLHSDDWQHRVDNLRQIRSIFKGNQLGVDDYIRNLRHMDMELKGCISDLRSQVVREACITVAYLSKEIKNKLEIFIEQLLDNLLSLVPNGAKIMSSSGKIALKIIVDNTQSPRILSFFLTSVTTSKSTSARQFSSEIMKFICENWPIKNLERNVNNISETLKIGISDSDEKARANSRESFCWLNSKFPQIADKLLQSLDVSKQKALQKELSIFTNVNEPEVFKVPASRPAKLVNVNTKPRTTNINDRNRITSAKSENQSVKPNITTSKVEYGDGRGRQTKISQSQPATRETSPAYKSNYSTFTNGCTQIPKKGGSSNVYNSLRHKEMEFEVSEGLKATKDKNYDHYQSDDNTSDTSSVMSDQLPSFSDLIVLLHNKNWNDRKRGLKRAEKYIMECQLKPSERKSFIDVFNSMFQENQTVVMKQFLGLLYVFFDKHHEQLTDWIYSLLGKLVNTHSNDRLKSCKHDVHKILILLIDRYGAPTMFMHCCKYLIDKTQELSIKMKISVLDYLNNVLNAAEPGLLASFNSDVGPALANIIIFTAETKSTELRKLSSTLVIKLFDLDSVNFSRLLKTLPNSFQERATTILDAFISSIKDDTTSSDLVDSRTPRQKTYPDNTSEIIKINTEVLQNMSLNCDNIDRHSNSSNRSVTSPNNWGSYQKNANHNPFFQNKQGHIPVPKSNSVSSTNTKLYDSNNIHKYLASQNSHPELFNTNSNQSSGLHAATSNESNVDTKYNPEYYSSGPIENSALSKGDGPPNNSGSITRIHKPVIGYQTLRKIAELAPEDVMHVIVKELSNHNDRNEERRACLFKLIKMFRENTPTDWEEHFKTLLFLLLETMGDNNSDVRAQALRVLQELAKYQSVRFVDYTQLTILRVLEAHKDSDKSVVKAAEECSRILTTTMPRLLSLKMLIDIISDGNENMLCLAALKMLIKLSKIIERQHIDSEIETLCQALSLVVNHKESQVRKESILCLVELHKIIGDDVWSRVKLTTSQVRLLDVYIKKNDS